MKLRTCVLVLSFLPLVSASCESALSGDASHWTLTPLVGRPEDADPTSIYDQNDLMPSASRNGEFVLFTSRRTGEFRQYIMKVDGSDVHVITSGPGRQMQGVWSPDGKRIVYIQRTQEGKDKPIDRHLVVCNSDGSEPREVAEIPGNWQIPSWTPDGKRILYHAPGPNGSDDIWSVDVDTGERKVVLGSVAADRQASLSPDGRRIVFISKRDGDDDEIYIANLNGGPWTQLTDNQVGDYTPSWSPEGSRIVFQSPRAGKWTIFTINPDGSDETPITQYPGQYDPVWSFDGTEIFFNSDRDGRRGIYVMNADGLNQRKLTNVKSSTFVTVVREAGVDEAARLFHSARAANPEAVYFYEEEVQYLGENYLEMGFFLQATVLFQINAEAYPKSKAAHMNLGKTQLAAGEEGAAIKSYQRALEIDPEDSQIPVLLKQLSARLEASH